MIGRKLLAMRFLQDWMVKSIHLPAPDGSFVVGTREFTLTHPDPQPEDGKIRKISVKAWYPAQAASGEPECYFSDLEMAQLHASPGPNQYAYLTRIKTHSWPDAQFANSAGVCPVLIYSHGHSASNRTNRLVCESLASHGYVVLAIGHTGEGFCTLIDGKKIGMDLAIGDAMIAEMKEIQNKHPGLSWEKNGEKLMRLVIEEGYYTNERIHIWDRDLSLVADWVDAGADDFFAGKLQSRRFAAFGHSFGAAAALSVMVLDERFVCGANLDGGQFGGDFMNRVVHKPMLVMAHDAAVARAGFTAAQKGIHWLSISSASHLNFTDGSLVYGAFPRWIKANGKINGSRMILLMNTLLKTFFDRYFLGKTVDISAAVQSFPEVKYQYEQDEDQL